MMASSPPSAKRRKLDHSNKPHWTEHPEEPDVYADWTLVVKDGTNKQRSFAIHRVILGPKSDYFDAMFKNAFSENGTRTSTFEFQKHIVQNFHMFLDFCYDIQRIPDAVELLPLQDLVFPNQLVSAWYLSDYFGVKEVFERCKESIKTFISSPECPNELLVDLYQFCKKHYFDELYEALVESCVSNVMQLKRDSGMPLAIDAEFLLHVLKSANTENKRQSFDWSHVVSRYCEAQRQNTDYSMFLRLTNEKNLPFLCPSAACRFLRMLRYYGKGGAKDLSKLPQMSSIEARCMSALYCWIVRKPTCPSSDDYLQLVIDDFPAMAGALFKNAVTQINTPLTPRDPHTNPGMIGSSSEGSVVPSERRIYSISVNVRSDKGLAGIHFSAYCGKAVVSVRWGGRHSKIVLGDVLLSVEGIALEASSSQDQLNAQIKAALPDDAAIVDLIFMHDPVFCKQFTEVICPIQFESVRA